MPLLGDLEEVSLIAYGAGSVLHEYDWGPGPVGTNPEIFLYSDVNGLYGRAATPGTGAGLEDGSAFSAINYYPDGPSHYPIGAVTYYGEIPEWAPELPAIPELAPYLSANAAADGFGASGDTFGLVLGPGGFTGPNLFMFDRFAVGAGLAAGVELD